jgi:hypothetical protein
VMAWRQGPCLGERECYSILAYVQCRLRVETMRCAWASTWVRGTCEWRRGLGGGGRAVAGTIEEASISRSRSNPVPVQYNLGELRARARPTTSQRTSRTLEGGQDSGSTFNWGSQRVGERLRALRGQPQGVTSFAGCCWLTRLDLDLRCSTCDGLGQNQRRAARSPEGGCPTGTFSSPP